jgi:hypothetical protein
MSSEYKIFGDLKQEVVVTLDTPEKIFFRMHDFAMTENVALSTWDIYELNESMPDGKYWISNDYYVAKGKKRIFKSDVVCAYKEEIIKFVQLRIEKNRLSYLIMEPIFEYEYQFVVVINNDSGFLIFKNR